MWDRIGHWFSSYAPQVLGAIIILVVGYFLARGIRQLLKRLLTRTKMPPVVQGFVGQIAFILILLVAGISALDRFGVETASIVAILGAMSFAIGFALQGSLSNFASGVLLVILRPFRIGDVIEAGGVIGTVKDIQLFSTVVATPDNVKVYIPNAQVYGGTIRNYNGYQNRRIDVPVGIGYGASIEESVAIARRTMAEDERILGEPAAEVFVSELADSSVNLTLRCWVQGKDYWGVSFDLKRRIKEAFDQNRIEIPFPQHVVHMARDD